MRDKYISTEEAKQIVAMGFKYMDWAGPIMSEKIISALVLPRMRIDQAAKWLREEWGIDIVISPRFNSRTGDRIGYFWRWSQRTDVNMHPKIHKSYEAALSDAISIILNQFTQTEYDN